MTIISLSPLDLSLAALLVGVLALISRSMRLKLENQLVIAAVRMTVQLLIIGVVLKALFSHAHLGWVALMAGVMLLAAGWEVRGRQKRRFAGGWGFGLGTLSMFISSFSITVIALTVIIGPQPWYEPQYAIPLMCMLLANTINNISIAME